jgi:hypothetical protein
MLSLPCMARQQEEQRAEQSINYTLIKVHSSGCVECVCKTSANLLSQALHIMIHGVLIIDPEAKAMLCKSKPYST